MRNNFEYNAKQKWEKKQSKLHARIGKQHFRFIEDEKRMSKHHVPPKVPDKEPRIIKVDERHHRAYHLILGNPASFEEACRILWRDWWCKDNTPMPTVRGRDLF